MIRLRQYKSIDAEKIAEWVSDENAFLLWGGDHFGAFPISAEQIDTKYRSDNGDCIEPDNFYPCTAFDDEGVFGHFIMRYLDGNPNILRFGWVVVDQTKRGKGYGTKMLKAGLKYAFEILGVDVVTIGVFENNRAGRLCYQRVGFRETHTVENDPCDVIEMEITRDQWSEK